MLHGDVVRLRARQAEDVPILHAGLYEDVTTRSRADSRPWRPVPSELSTFKPTEPSDGVAIFSVVAVETDELLGSALLWSIDTHNRTAHLGMGLLPAARGRGVGKDVVRVLTRYGFETLGLQRLQVDTLADNFAMIRAAEAGGYVLDGLLRKSAWVNGVFLDEVILGLLREDWTQP